MSITEIKQAISMPGPTATLPTAAIRKVSDLVPTANSGKESPQAANIDNVSTLPVEPEKIIDDLMKNLDLNSQLQFAVDDETGRLIVSVLDGDTSEVIRRFPSEQSMAIARYISEFAEAPRVGLLLETES